jgi:hypothetical protein
MRKTRPKIAERCRGPKASVDVDVSVASDHRVAGNPDHTLDEVEIACVRARRDGATRIDTYVNDDHLASVRS